MRTLEEIEQQRISLKPIANSPNSSRDRELARALLHVLSWVLGETDYMPPSEMMGWVTTNIEKLTAAVNREPGNQPLATKLLSVIQKMRGS